jgi:hypothetical protein
LRKANQPATSGPSLRLRVSLEKELERHLNSTGVVRLRAGGDLAKGRLAGIQVDCSRKEQGMVKGIEEFCAILEFLFPFTKPCLFDDADVPVVDVGATDVTETNREGTNIRCQDTLCVESEPGPGVDPLRKATLILWKRDVFDIPLKAMFGKSPSGGPLWY